MAKDDPHFRLRIPAELKAEVEASAAKNKRSINAEIVALVERALQEKAVSNTEIDNDIRYVTSKITDMIRQGGAIQFAYSPAASKHDMTLEMIAVYSHAIPDEELEKRSERLYPYAEFKLRNQPEE